MFFPAVATAARSESSAWREASRSSGVVTASLSAVSLAPSKRWGELQQRVVAASLDGLDDSAGAVFDGLVEKARRAGQGAQPPDKTRVCVPEDVHAARRLVDGDGEVKAGAVRNALPLS